MSVVQRRYFLAAMSGTLIAPTLGHASSGKVEAIAFDAFPIFDPRSFVDLAADLLGEAGKGFISQWSEKLFGYT